MPTRPQSELGVGCHPQRFLPRFVSFCLIRLIIGLCIGLGAWPAWCQESVLTYHNDDARTGQNLNETILTPANVNSTQFGKLFSQPVDGYVYTQPLYVPGLTIPGKGEHNVIFVATEHDSVYAFDADANSGVSADPLWHVSFIDPPGIKTVSNADVDSNDLVPEIGITGTPVIDLSTNTLYVVAKTKETANSAVTYVQRLHALDLATGAEKFGGPVIIQATVSGTGDGGATDTFDALRQNQRPGLALVHQLIGGVPHDVIYIAWASHGDKGVYHGWLLGYDSQTLQQVASYITTPNGAQGGIWQSGCPPAVDSDGNLFFLTGNGTFSVHYGGIDYGDSALRLTTGDQLAVADYFTPWAQAAMDKFDVDFGSGGILLLPDEVGSATHPHLLVGCGKEGVLYLLDRDHLGGHFVGIDHVVQEITKAVGGGAWSTPAYWNGLLYYGGRNDYLKAFSIANAQLSTSPTFESTTYYAYPGPTPSISANGATNAIVWTLQNEDYDKKGPAILHAYDATNIATELYNSNENLARDNPGPAVKFTVPTIVNGKVYVGTQTQLSVYGLLPANLPPQVSLTLPANGASFSAPADILLTATASDRDGSISQINFYEGTTQVATTSTAPYKTFLQILQPGTYTLSAAATDNQGAVTTSNTSTITITPSPYSTYVALDCGGSGAGAFDADADFSGGTIDPGTSQAINTSKVTDPAPEAVYQSARDGNLTYTIPNLKPGWQYTVRLHFAELECTAPKQRQFDIAINGHPSATNFDIFAAAGARFKAVVKQFSPFANSTGNIAITLTGVIGNPQVNGIEVIE